MPIEVKCPKCGTLAQAPDQTMGKMGTCPTCQTKFMITAPAPPAPIAPGPGGLQTPPGVQLPGMYAPRGQQPATSGMAIASLVLGILSTIFCVLTGLPALILGIVSLGAIGRSKGSLQGNGMAIAGICLGSVSLLLIPIVAAIAIPNLLRSRLAANESVTVGSLKTVATQQAIFRQQCEVDQDKNGSGEYGLLGELAGEIALRPSTEKTVNPPYISNQYRTGGNAGNGMAQKSGYMFKLYLSNAAGDNMAAAGDDRTMGGNSAMGGPAANPAAIRMQETSFAVYAWPAERHSTGMRAFFISEAGEVYATNMEGKTYDGASGPAADAAYVEGGPLFQGHISSGMTKGNDGNQWNPAY